VDGVAGDPARMDARDHTVLARRVRVQRIDESLSCADISPHVCAPGRIQLLYLLLYKIEEGHLRETEMARDLGWS